MKIGNLDISSIKVGSADCKVYIGDTLLYPTAPPAFQGKWLATYTGGTTSSAECDASSAITQGQITSLADLESVVIGDCVTSIGNNTFRDCRSLTSITIPDSVTSIGDYALSYCSSLTSVTIPDSVTSIGARAFFSSTTLVSVTVLATTPPTLGTNVFLSTNNCLIYVPASSVSTYQSASRWSTYASRIQAIPT